jgi:hypothetical protein
MAGHVASVHAVIASIACCVGLAPALAGPLTSPAGPVAPTPGPEPRIAVNATNTPPGDTATFIINRPGSYYLATNIVAAPGKHGILVVSGGVTVDLNGFDLVGNTDSQGFHGVFVLATAFVRIHTGSLRGWGGNGIDVGVTRGAVITDVRSTDNIGYGIRGGLNTVVRDCVTVNNASGIRVEQGSTVDRCISSENAFNGIAATNACIIANNNCNLNGKAGDGAGIIVTGTDSRIESNNSIRADRGIDITAAGNIIIKNTCSGNTLNWSIAANNIFGPIIDRTAPGTAAVSGNSAPSSLDSADANANFSY